LEDFRAFPVVALVKALTAVATDTRWPGASLTPAPACYVVTRGCRFTAQDSFTRDPKLAALEPIGTALGGNGSADIAQSGLTCAGTEAPGVMDKHWTVEPTAWRLTWGGVVYACTSCPP